MLWTLFLWGGGEGRGGKSSSFSTHTFHIDTHAIQIRKVARFALAKARLKIVKFYQKYLSGFHTYLGLADFERRGFTDFWLGVSMGIQGKGL